MAAPGRPQKCHPDIQSLWMDIEHKDNAKVICILNRHNIDIADGEGRTALIHAVAYDNKEIFNWTIANHADVNIQDRIGYTALHFAAQNNSFEWTKRLIAKGANINVQDVHGNIPLWTAMFNSKLIISDTTRLLLKHNSNVELVNNYGKNCRFMYKTFFNGDISTVDVSNI